MKQQRKPIRISRLAFIEGNSHYGRGTSEEQRKEMAEFERYCADEEHRLNKGSD